MTVPLGDVRGMTVSSGSGTRVVDRKTCAAPEA